MSLYDHDMVGSHDFLGRIGIPVCSIEEGGGGTDARALGQAEERATAAGALFGHVLPIRCVSLNTHTGNVTDVFV